MLALASLFRCGNGFQTQRLKLSAIQALAASARHGVTTHNAAQHISAGLILCLVEVYAPPGGWPIFLCSLFHLDLLPLGHLVPVGVVHDGRQGRRRNRLSGLVR